MRMQQQCHVYGMTLLEVLIATAILAMVTAACLPVISQVMTLLRHDKLPDAVVDIVDLGIVADAFVSSPATFGWKEKPLHQIERWEFQWPVAVGAGGAGGTGGAGDDEVAFRPAIRVQAIARRGGDASADHLWLHFECDDVGVCRWVAIPEHDSAPDRPANSGANSEKREVLP